MNGQRFGLIRGTLALLLCAVLLSTLLAPTYANVKPEPPSSNGPALNDDGPVWGDGSSGDDGGGSGDPQNEGDPDDYDKILLEIWSILVEIPVFLLI